MHTHKQMKPYTSPQNFSEIGFVKGAFKGRIQLHFKVIEHRDAYMITR